MAYFFGHTVFIWLVDWRVVKVGDGSNQLAVLDAVADLRFADDFAEYVARAEGGGSTYGLLRRHAFAQTSLRLRRPSARDDDANSRPAATRQRRSRSLVPPPRRERMAGSPVDSSMSNHKTLLQALCAQTQHQQKQQRRQSTSRTGTLQVPYKEDYLSIDRSSLGSSSLGITSTQRNWDVVKTDS